MKIRAKALLYISLLILLTVFTDCGPEDPVIERGSFSGTVFSKNVRLSRAIVKLKQSGASNTVSQETGSGGTFKFSDLAFGVYNLEVEFEGHLPFSKTSEITIDENTRDIEGYVINLIPFGAISGKVTNQLSSAPVASALVELSGNRTESIQTNDSGDFQFDNITAGNYSIKVTANGFEEHQKALEIGDGENLPLAVVLKPLPSISGTVLNREDDNPIFEVKVSIEGTGTADVLTDSQGKFNFPNLSPGDYTIKLDKQGFESVQDVINLPEGSSIVRVYKLLPEEVTSSVSGKVTNKETGQGIPQVKLSLSGTSAQDVFTNENGNYAFTDLMAGPYSINTNKNGFIQHQEDFALGTGEDKNLIISLTPSMAELSVSPTTLDFVDTKTILPIEISNTGDGLLSWEIIENIPWLTISDESGSITGSERQTVTVSVNRASLNQGNYENVFTISSNGGNVVVEAKVEVKTLLCVDPTDLNFGTSTEAKSVFVENCGNGTIDYSVVPDSDWIKVSTSSGTVTNEKDPISIGVDHTNLNPGNYTGQVIFNSNSGSTEVVITMTVPNLSEPQLTLSDDILDFGTSIAEKVITVTNTGKQTLSWNLAKEQNWMIINKENGELNEGESEDIKVQVFRSGLSPNEYVGNLEFTSNGGQRNIPVKMTVAATPILQQSTQFLDFGYETKQLTFDIDNIGNATLQWQIETDVNWITVIPKTGTDAATVTVFVNRDNVNDGSYNGNITINSNGGIGVISAAMIKAPPPPNMVLENVAFKSDANESGTPNPGESVTYTVTLRNDNGASEGRDIKVEFSSPGPYVNSFSPSELSFGNVPINETVERDITINFSTLAEVGQTVDINMTIKDINGQSWSESFSVEMKSFFVVSQGLLAYYRFDEGDFRDETGQYKGFGIGPQHTSDTPDGSGLSIEFKAEEKDFFYTAKNIISGIKQATYNFWIKTEGNDMYLFNSSLHYIDDRNRIYITTDGRIQANSWDYYRSTNFNTDTSEILLNGSWHMLTVSIINGQHRLYIDGELRENISLQYELYNTANNEGFVFGKRPLEDDLFFNGKMDNIRIYDRVLSEEEVALLYEKKQ
ncbi:MAG: hypothetical protein HEP71_24180 [Roseivirga sp.]|nr:hypothetical protein [Roseivirga sp.]